MNKILAVSASFGDENGFAAFISRTTLDSNKLMN